MQITKNLSDAFAGIPVGPNQTRVGLISFADNAKVEFALNTLTTTEDVRHAIETVTYTRGKTHTADALRLLKHGYSPKNGGRKDSLHIAVIITDGQSNVQSGDTLRRAVEARIAGVHIIVVAIETHANLEIKGIASNPDEANVLHVSRYSELPDVLPAMITAMCNGVVISCTCYILRMKYRMNALQIQDDECKITYLIVR